MKIIYATHIVITIGHYAKQVYAKRQYVKRIYQSRVHCLYRANHLPIGAVSVTF